MNTQHGIAEINGAQLYYETAGSGFPLVMVHAGVADSRMWDHQFAYFAQTYRVIRYDQRGYGQSPMVPGPFAYWADLHGLLTFLGVERAALMGCSMGGGAVVDFTLAHPEMAAALVLVGSALTGYQNDDEDPPFMQELQDAYQKGDFDSAAEYAVRVWVDSAHRKPAEVDPAVRAKVYEMTRLSFNSPDVGQPQILTPYAVTRLEELRAPLLAIVGDLDVPVIDEIADLVTASVPGAKKVIMTNTAHLPNMERPDEFNQLVSSFLDSLNL